MFIEEEGIDQLMPELRTQGVIEPPPSINGTIYLGHTKHSAGEGLDIMVPVGTFPKDPNRCWTR